ncbi:YafY family transcriptional regulator [Aquincola tertiaricarbonis]|uniref:YafY family transcriptional regulator n=1 Tax=Aquincola tertiaricarbonis TaxID=391953 RepID=A0ABY4SBE2_AQUTE|nr:YafY family protein [Aquincola tertiaricarbonis]URI09789.1 YafY family transcriptional regulator [Aquincola tertiaricarbonis]
MSRTTRLLDLIQLLRRHRRPVSGSAIAQELGISLRTLYRDIATLQGQGAAIDGAPGLGYVLREGFVLPPLMFSAEELEAVVLGMRWVAQRADSGLAAAARDALAKIGAVLPRALQAELEGSTLLVAGLQQAPGRAPGSAQAEAPAIDPALQDAHAATVRRSIRQQHKLVIDYRDGQRRSTQRTVWPFALGYFDRAQVVVAWCELRADIRHFRCDRIAQVQPLAQRYPQRREALLKAWREREGIAAP